jgi:hypothetical protein
MLMLGSCVGRSTFLSVLSVLSVFLTVLPPFMNTQWPLYRPHPPPTTRIPSRCPWGLLHCASLRRGHHHRQVRSVTFYLCQNFHANEH